MIHRSDVACETSIGEDPMYAESEFEKYRIVQDRLFMSDYDRYLLELEAEIKK